MDGYGDGWWMAMWVALAACWALVLGSVAWLAWRATRSRSDGSSAEDILEQRLARGEINVEQYRMLSRELRNRVGAQGRGGGPIGPIMLFVVVALTIALLTVPAIALAENRGVSDMFDHMSRMMGGGGRDTANAPLVVGGDAETITISDLTFSPGNLQIPVGATVTFVNRDSPSHNATSRDGSWKTDTLSEGMRDTVMFDQRGEYDYYCSSIHR